MDQRPFKAVCTIAAVALTGIPPKEEKGKKLLNKCNGRWTVYSIVSLDYNKDFRAFLWLLTAPCSPGNFINNEQDENGQGD